MGRVKVETESSLMCWFICEFSSFRNLVKGDCWALRFYRSSLIKVSWDFSSSLKSSLILPRVAPAGSFPAGESMEVSCGTRFIRLLWLLERRGGEFVPCDCRCMNCTPPNSAVSKY